MKRFRNLIPGGIACLTIACVLTLTGCGLRSSETWKLKNIRDHLPDLQFNLTSSTSKSVTAKDFRGKVVLLYFGYTHCPDICPMTLSKLSGVVRDLGSESNAVRIVFISVDPKRDTPKLMHQYAEAFSPEAVGLTGSLSEIESLARRYRVAYQATKPDSHGNYDVMHSKAVYVFDQTGHVRFMIRESDTKKDIVHDLRQLIGKPA